MAATSELKVKISADDQASAELQKVGKSFDAVGAAAGAAAAAIAAKFVASMKDLGAEIQELYFAQERALATVAAGVARRGQELGLTFQDLRDEASRLQEVGIFGDEDILQNVTAQLLTFRNISGDIFMDAQEAILDYTATTGKSLIGSSIMIARALNDPAQGMARLAISGIEFDEVTKDLIKSLQEEGRLLEAQRIMLDQIEAEYGSVNAAIGATDFGGWEQFMNTLGDLKEDFGAILNDAIKPLISELENLLGWFQDLSPQAKHMIVLFGIMATGIAIIIGLTVALTVAVSALGVATALATGGLTLVLGAIALGIAWIISHWAEFKFAVLSTLLLINHRFKQFGTFVGNLFRGLINGLIDSLLLLAKAYNNTIGRIPGTKKIDIEVLETKKFDIDWGGVENERQYKAELATLKEQRDRDIARRSDENEDPFAHLQDLATPEGEGSGRTATGDPAPKKKETSKREHGISLVQAILYEISGKVGSIKADTAILAKQAAPDASKAAGQEFRRQGLALQ